MSTMSMRRVVVFVGLIAGISSLPSMARAAKVAIAPVEYALVDGSPAAPEAAAQVEEKIAEAAREAGFEVVRDAAVTDAAISVPACAAALHDKACLAAIARKLGAEDAISVRVTDDDHTSYRVEFVYARREASDDERTAGFFVVLEWVKGAAALALQKPAARPEPAPTAAPAAPATAEPGKPDLSDRSDVSDRSDKSDRRKLPPALFWSGVGLTGALAIAWAATDIAAWKSDAGNDHVRKLQVADGVLLGCGLGAAVATTVVFFFTDFGSDSVSVAPVATGDGGGLVLHGRF
jgi:hypothetical protein